MSEFKKSGFHYSYMIVMTCCVVCMAPVAMTFSCAGIFYTPVSTAMGVGRGVFGVYMTILCLTMTFTLPFAGKILADYNIRGVLSTCVIITVGSFVVMSRFTSVYQFYFAGFFLGVANAFMLYLMTPTLVNAWFKTRAGFFMGFCLSFTGIGGIIFNPIGGYIITNYGWRYAYLSFAVMSAVLALPFTLFVVRKNPAEIGLKPFGETSETQPSAVLTGVSVKDALRSGAFYFVAIFAGLVSLLSCVNFYLPSFANTLGMSATIGATVASASMFGNIIGKVLLGYLNDKSVALALTFGVACGIAGILMLMLIGATGVMALLIGGFLFGICYATTVTIPPMLTRTIFGSRQYGQIYSNIMMVASLCSALGASLWGFIADATGSFVASFSVAVCTSVIAIVVGLIALKAKKSVVMTKGSVA